MHSSNDEGEVEKRKTDLVVTIFKLMILQAFLDQGDESSSVDLT